VAAHCSACSTKYTGHALSHPDSCDPEHEMEGSPHHPSDLGSAHTVSTVLGAGLIASNGVHGTCSNCTLAKMDKGGSERGSG
jgi:hypothetical protein